MLQVWVHLSMTAGRANRSLLASTPWGAVHAGCGEGVLRMPQHGSSQQAAQHGSPPAAAQQVQYSHGCMMLNAKHDTASLLRAAFLGVRDEEVEAAAKLAQGNFT